MIDIAIVALSFITLLFFIVALALIMRSVGQMGVMSWIKRVFIALCVVSSSAGWMLLTDVSPASRIELLVIHLLLNFLFCFAYIDGLFGLPLTSVRIQLLLTLASRIRMKRSYLASLYTRERVIKQCLYRLETSGEIERLGKGYTLKSPRSYFVTHTYFLVFLLWLYRPISLKNTI